MRGLLNLINFVSSVNRIPPDISQEGYQFLLFLKKSILLVSFGHLLFLGITIWYGEPSLIVLSIVALAIDVLAMVLILRGKINLSLLIIFTYIVLFSAYCICVFGGSYSFSLYYIVLIAVVFITPWKLANKIIYSLFIILAFLFATFHSGANPLQESLKAELVFNIFNTIVCGVVIAMIIYYYQTKTRQAQEELTAVYKTRERLYSIIAHDLRGPLGTLTNVADLIHNSMKSGRTKPNVLKLTGVMSKTTHEAYTLLENLLTWTQNQNTDIIPEITRVDVLKLFKSCVELNQPNILLKQLTVKIPEDVRVLVQADKNMIFTLLRNLVSNAIKFSQPHGEIGIKVAEESNFARFIIYDNGIGMSRDLINNAFLINNRKLRLGTNNEKGTGLGLVLCKELIDKNGGKIGIDSEPGVGTQVIFELPTEK